MKMKNIYILTTKLNSNTLVDDLVTPFIVLRLHTRWGLPYDMGNIEILSTGWGKNKLKSFWNKSILHADNEQQSE